ncbi:hybrid sensor histidine kinase/response regulator [Salinarimonas soli]|uniref:histidine kinase n=1 Tax=Salinarimonas soli TaxID=1638099 RepID=A0A5B2VV09_9HYPH|nr:PAS domain-containing protein [Salinarimonas soli]KAA2242152.1 PAS domain-containing protein [Salinarimonas soli]
MTRVRRHSIRHHLLVLVVAVLAPVLLLAGGLTAWLVRAEREAYEQSVAEAARDLGATVEREVAAIEMALRVLATSPTLQAGDVGAFFAQAAGVARQEGVILTLRDPASRQLANTAVPWGDRLPERTSLAEVDAEAGRRRAAVVSPLYRGVATDEPYFAVVLPVIRDGEIRYFLSAAAGVRRLGGLLTGEHPREGWSARLVDGKGVTLATAPWRNAAVGQALPADLLAAARTGGQGLWRCRDAAGERTIVGFSPAGRTGWLVATSVPASLARAGLLRALAVLGAASAVLIGVALLAAFALSGRLSRSVERLSQGAGAILRGDPAPRVSGDVAEVGQVEAALHQAGAELREREAMFRTMADSAPVGVWVADAERGSSYVNRAWYDLTGMAPGTGLGFGWLEAVHPEDRPRIEAAIGVHNAGNIARTLEYRLRRADGTYAYVLDSSAPRLGENGEVLGHVGSVVDLSRRYEAEEALRQSEERLRLAQEAGRISSWDVDLATGDATWLGAWRSVIGDWGDEKPSQALFMRIVHPDDREQVRAALDAALSSQASYDSQFRVVWPDGGVHWIVERGEIVRDASGKPIRMRGIAFDVTARMEAQIALAQLNADLERRVEERTEALRQEAAERRRAELQLHQAQKMEAIGRLTGGLAHDLNNKLQVISAQIDTALRRLKNEPAVSKGLLSAAVAADRCAELITKLLAFARNDEAQPTVIDLEEALVSITALLDRSLLGDSVELKLDVASDLWPIEIDASHFEAALVNLVVNARDAMPDGGTIVIGARNVKAGEARLVDPRLAGDCVEIRAIDTGVGIAPEHIDKVIEPFFTTKPAGKGTGLGLSQVYGLVTGAGGVLLFDSAPGEGTTVSLYIPRARVEARIGAPGLDEPIEDEALPDRRGTVLLVDDDVDVADAVKAVLAQRGYRVEVATGAEEALDAIERRPVDLVLSDVTMPGGLSGVELAQAVRARRPGMPVVLITGNPRALGDHDGEFPLVVKPITGRKLEEAIEREIGPVTAKSAEVVRLHPRSKGA